LGWRQTFWCNGDRFRRSHLPQLDNPIIKKPGSPQEGTHVGEFVQGSLMKGVDLGSPPSGPCNKGTVRSIVTRVAFPPLHSMEDLLQDNGLGLVLEKHDETMTCGPICYEYSVRSPAFTGPRRRPRRASNDCLRCCGHKFSVGRQKMTLMKWSSQFWHLCWVPVAQFCTNGTSRQQKTFTQRRPHCGRVSDSRMGKTGSACSGTLIPKQGFLKDGNCVGPITRKGPCHSVW